MAKPTTVTMERSTLVSISTPPSTSAQLAVIDGGAPPGRPVVARDGGEDAKIIETLDIASLTADPEQLKREVLMNAGAALVAQYEAGIRLLKLKLTLGHGHWEAYLTEEFPMGRRTAQSYMEFARLVGSRERLRQVVQAGISVKKAKLLFQLPEEDLKALQETGLVGGLPLEEIAGRPYAQLKDELEKLAKKEATAQAELIAARDQLKEAKEALAAKSIEEAKGGDKFLAEIQGVRRDFDEAMGLVGRLLQKGERLIYEDNAGRDPRRNPLTPRARAELVAFLTYARNLAEHEYLRFLEATGETGMDAEYLALLDRDAQMPASYRIPDVIKLK